MVFVSNPLSRYIPLTLIQAQIPPKGLIQTQIQPKGLILAQIAPKGLIHAQILPKDLRGQVPPLLTSTRRKVGMKRLISIRKKNVRFVEKFFVVKFICLTIEIECILKLKFFAQNVQNPILELIP
jgi:hypothetical protein